MGTRSGEPANRAAAVRTRSRRSLRRLVALVTAVFVVLTAGCDRGSGEPDPANRPPVTLTWWLYPADGPVPELWRQVAAEFERKHPWVTITITTDPDTGRPVAPSGDGGPDLFEVAGGAWDLVGRVRAGTVLDLTDLVGPELDRLGGAAAAWRVDGRQYGLPYSTGVEGIWYRPSLFARAGITAPPATMAELNDAVGRLKAAGIIPVVVDAGNAWPLMHWWSNFALRRCRAEVLAQAADRGVFADPCFVRAGEDFAAFVATDPFQPFVSCVTCNAGEAPSWRLVRGEAAMELMGHWHGEVLAGYARDLGQDPDALRADLAWFPFPSVPGGEGGATAVLGGGKGLACSAQAPPECVELLRYIVGPSMQSRLAESPAMLPALPAGGAAVADRYPQPLLPTLYAAERVQLWLDVALGPTVGTALTEAVVALFQGHIRPEAVVSAMDSAARRAP